MKLLQDIFGSGTDLTSLQMGSRGLLMFFIALVLIRISGRRSFSLHMPLDNIITITLGAVMSRAIVGASPILPVITTCVVIAGVHRMMAWLTVKNQKASKLMEGEKLLLFSNGTFHKKNMDKALVSKEDVMQGVRRNALTRDLGHIKEIYIERNGEISSIRD